MGIYIMGNFKMVNRKVKGHIFGIMEQNIEVKLNDIKIGMFKNGVRHGKGAWSKWDPLKEGHYRYEGMFENDKKHG